MIFPENFIKKRVKYKVMPIGIKTTIPAIKLLRNLVKKDFLCLIFIGQELSFTFAKA